MNHQPQSEPKKPRVKKDGSPYAKPVRRAWARLRNVSAGGSLYHLQLVKAVRVKGEQVTPPGVLVKERCKRGERLVSADELVAGLGSQFTAYKIEYRAVISELGVKVRRKGFKNWKLVPWDAMVDKAEAEGKDPEQFKMPFDAATIARPKP